MWTPFFQTSAIIIISFAAGILLGPAVKAMLGWIEEDVDIEVGLLRTDLKQMAQLLETRIKALEDKLERK